MNIAELIGQTQEGSGQQVLPGSFTNSPFILQFHPMSWVLAQHEGESVMIPHLRHFKLKAGVNGVRFAGEGRVNAEAALAHAASCGWRSIPYGALAEYHSKFSQDVFKGKSARSSYVARTRTTRGWHYHTLWDSFLIHGQMVQPTRDRDGYLLFCASLLEEGIIPQASEHARDAVTQRYERHAQRIKIPTDPSIRRAEELARVAATEVADLPL